MCLNHDTVCASELINEIDAMISELEALKKQVPQRFEQWKQLFDTAD